MGAFRLYAYDWALFKAKSAADTSRVPAAATVVKAYRRGATAAETKVIGTVGGETLAIHDPGDITINDVVQLGVLSPEQTRQVSDITNTQLTFAAGGTGAFSVVDGDRIIVSTPRPLTYTDVSAVEATPTASQITVGASGEGIFYSRHRIIDAILDNAGTRTLATDIAGLAGTWSDDLGQWGAIGDNATNNAAAFTAAFNRAKLAGSAVLELPPGTFRLNSTVTSLNGGSLIIRGAGASQTIIAINHAGVGIDFTGTNQDIVFEDLAFQRLTGTTAMVQLAVGGVRVAFRNCWFTGGGIGVTDAGTDNRYENCRFYGGSWTSFVRFAGAKRCHMVGCYSAFTGAITRAIDIDTGSEAIRLLHCDFRATTLASDGGTIVNVRDSGAGTDPRDIVLFACHLVGGTGGSGGPGVDIDACEGVQLVGCTIEDSIRGVVVDGGEGVKIIGGLIAAVQNEAVDINGGSHIHILGLDSSDVNKAAASKDHINIAGATDVSVIGLDYGNYIRNGATLARFAVSVEASAGNGIQVSHIHGDYAALSSAYPVQNLSTSAIVDYGHILSDASSSHFPGPANANIADPWGLLTITTGTSIQVINASTVVFAHAAPASVTTFTGGTVGQEITLIFTNGNTTIVDGAPIALAGSVNFVGTADDVLKLILSTDGQWKQSAPASVN